MSAGLGKAHAPEYGLWESFYLHAILQLRNDRTVADELEQLTLPVKGQRDDEGHEDRHLEHEESEDLDIGVSIGDEISCVIWLGGKYGRVDQTHVGGRCLRRGEVGGRERS